MATDSYRRIRESVEFMEKKEKEMDAELDSLDADAAQKHKEYMQAYGKWHDFHEQVVRDKAIIAERKANLAPYLDVPGDLEETTRELEELLAGPPIAFREVRLPAGTDIVPMLYSESARNAVRRPIRKPAPEVEQVGDKLRCSAEQESEIEQVDEDEVPLAVRRRKSLPTKAAQNPTPAKKVRFSMPSEAATSGPARKSAFMTTMSRARPESDNDGGNEDMSVASRTFTRPSAPAPPAKKAAPRLARIKSTNALGHRVITSAAERREEATPPTPDEPVWGFDNLSPVQQPNRSSNPAVGTAQQPSAEVIEIGDSEDEQPKRKKAKRSSGNHPMKVIPPSYFRR